MYYIVVLFKYIVGLCLPTRDVDLDKSKHLFSFHMGLNTTDVFSKITP